MTDEGTAASDPKSSTDEPTAEPTGRTITLALPPWALALLVGVIVIVVARHRRRRATEIS